MAVRKRSNGEDKQEGQPESLRKIFIEDQSTGKIRITRSGRDLLEKRFAKVGIDIKTITTKEAFRAAHEVLFDIEMREFAASVRGQDPQLDEILKGLPGWD